jgi:hypothetical protein
MHLEHAYAQNEGEKFLTEIVEYVKQNISSPDLSADARSRKMKMSWVSLFHPFPGHQHCFEYLFANRTHVVVGLIIDQALMLAIDKQEHRNFQ